MHLLCPTSSASPPYLARTTPVAEPTVDRRSTDGRRFPLLSVCRRYAVGVPSGMIRDWYGTGTGGGMKENEEKRA